MAIRIEHAEDKDAIAEFVALHDRVYASRAVRWQNSPLHLPMLRGMTPATIDRELRDRARLRRLRDARVTGARPALAELARERSARGLRARAAPRRPARAARAAPVRALERRVRQPLGLEPTLPRTHAPVRARRA